MITSEQLENVQEEYRLESDAKDKLVEMLAEKFRWRAKGLKMLRRCLKRKRVHWVGWSREGVTRMVVDAGMYTPFLRRFNRIPRSRHVDTLGSSFSYGLLGHACSSNSRRGIIRHQRRILTFLPVGKLNGSVYAMRDKQISPSVILLQGRAAVSSRAAMSNPLTMSASAGNNYAAGLDRDQRRPSNIDRARNGLRASMWSPPLSLFQQPICLW